MTNNYYHCIIYENSNILCFTGSPFCFEETCHIKHIPTHKYLAVVQFEEKMQDEALDVNVRVVVVISDHISLYEYVSENIKWYFILNNTKLLGVLINKLCGGSLLSVFYSTYQMQLS